MQEWPTINYASLDWIDGQPYNPDYADHYFARESGYDEARYIFLKQNILPDRWIGRDIFVVGETGFGSGLNFFVTVAEWLQTNAAGTLYYFSVEQHPLKPEDLRRVISLWPHLLRYADELLETYPNTIPGFHRIVLANGRVVLVLMIGEAVDMLKQVDARIDAWYLDGFAPAKNPSMWNQNLFDLIARSSQIGTTFATFTAAGFVRRGLQQSGFTVEKFVGFGNKREMLRGTLRQIAPVASATPWFDYPRATASNKRVAIIGAGIAGVATAHAFSERGWQVDLIEQNTNVASEASGNPVGIVLPRISAAMNSDGRYWIQAFLTTVQWLKRIGVSTWQQCGVLQRIEDNDSSRWKNHPLLDKLFTLPNEALIEKLAGLSIDGEMIYYPEAGFVSPPDICRTSLERFPAIQYRGETRINRLNYENGNWHLYGSNDVIVACTPFVVIANGARASQYPQLNNLGLTKVRGQISYLGTFNPLSSLRIPFCYDGYITPSQNGFHCVGASFEISDDVTERASDHEMNIVRLKDQFNSIRFPQIKSINGRVGVRTATRDHLPIVGAIPIESYYRETYADLRHGRRASEYSSGHYYPNLYANLALGARGLTTAYPNAVLIAELAEGLPITMPVDVVDCLHPARFWIRDLKRTRTGTK